MQKSIIPASFLSVAYNADIPIIEIENRLYLIREKKNQKINSSSHLHSLFFGSKTTGTLQTVRLEKITVDPDYYSSYE
jgi:adenine specific DNA methylase Mod